MAFCANCGTQLLETSVSCPQCGHPTGRAAPAYAATRTESLAVASLICGIAGFVLCPLILHILAIIFGTQARNKIRSDPSLEGEPLARAGIILGWIGVGLTVLAVAFAVLGLALGAVHSTIHLNPIPR